MAIGDLITRDGQYQLASLLLNTMGPHPDAGYIVTQADGIFGVPDVEHGDVKKQGEHGDLWGVDLLTGRTINLTVQILGSDKADFAARIDAVKGLFRPQTLWLEFAYRRNGVVRYQEVRPRRLHIVSDPTHGVGAPWTEALMELRASDPRWAAPNEDIVTYTITVGNNSIAGVQPNAGHMDAWPIFEIDGPVTNPRIANADDGNLQFKIDIVVPSGDTLVIDTKKKTVLLEGVDSYSSVRTDSQWFKIQPGNNDITFSRTGTTGTSVLRVKSRGSWL